MTTNPDTRTDEEIIAEIRERNEALYGPEADQNDTEHNEAVVAGIANLRQGI